MSFDETAKIWDPEIRINRAKKIAEEISKSINIDKNYSAMEFGCGTALLSFNLYDKFKEITLIDTSQGMIDVVKSKIKKYEVNNMFTNNTDISNKNSLDMEFDVIYNSLVLHEIHNTEGVIKNFYELLNKDGYLCIVDLDEEDGSFHKNYPDFHGHNGFNQDKLKCVLRSAGFKDIESNTFYYDVKAIGDEKIKYSLFLMKAKK